MIAPNGTSHKTDAIFLYTTYNGLCVGFSLVQAVVFISKINQNLVQYNIIMEIYSGFFDQLLGHITRHTTMAAYHFRNAIPPQCF